MCKIARLRVSEMLQNMNGTNGIALMALSGPVATSERKENI